MYVRTCICTYVRTYVYSMYVYVCAQTTYKYVYIRMYTHIRIMEYGSTPYVGLTPKKHGRHTLAEILFSPEN